MTNVIYTAKRKLGGLLITLRKKSGVSVKKLAQKCRVATGVILRLQSGIGSYAIDLVNRILSVLEVKAPETLAQVGYYLKVIHPGPRGPVFRQALV